MFGYLLALFILNVRSEYRLSAFYSFLCRDGSYIGREFLNRQFKKRSVWIVDRRKNIIVINENPDPSKWNCNVHLVASKIFSQV